MMKTTLLFLSITCYQFQLSGQDLPELFPSSVQELDFSQAAKAGWEKRNMLPMQMNRGEIQWESMTSDQRALFDTYPEVYKDIWDIVGGGDGWYNSGGPYQVTASSSLSSQGTNTYEAINAHDLNYENAWVEGAKGYGIGEYLTYHFKAASPRVTDIIIVNGYVKSVSAYRNNSRVKKLRVYLNDLPLAVLNLEDRIANQVFKLDPIGTSDRSDWDAMEKLPDWKLKFEILEVYKGTKYDDVVISEIYFDGMDVLCFAKGTEVLMADQDLKPIEALKIGDSITYADIQTQHMKKARIEGLEKVIHHDLVKYRFESGRTVTVTQDHPFQVRDKGWASLQPRKSSQYQGFDRIATIQIGDYFLTYKGSDRLVAIDPIKGAQETYTITQLSQGTNFIANGLIVGVEVVKKNHMQATSAKDLPKE